LGSSVWLTWSLRNGLPRTTRFSNDVGDVTLGA
jgi:hypothetical protein